ncbi:MAG TPA: hypothetical protein VFX50_15105, partial [Gemmatimonadales bacterium]|nr:hypothetical protein [Gemmatimonadales bacterium]
RSGTGALLAILVAACGEGPEPSPADPRAPDPSDDVATQVTPTATTPAPVLPVGAVVQLAPDEATADPVEWSLLPSESSPGEGALVDADGRLRTVAPGRYLLLAHRGDARTALQLTVREAAPPAPATLTVPFARPGLASLTADQFWIEASPDSLRLAPGDTAQFTAYGHSDDGTRWTIRSVWRAEGGTIGSTGRYVAPAQEGRHRVIVTRYGDVQTDTALVRVATASSAGSPSIVASASCNNEPTGYRRVANAPWSVLPKRQPEWSTEGFTYFHEQIPTLSLVQDGAAPASPSSLLRVFYPAGFRGGESPSRWGSPTLGANGGNLYVCLWIKYDAHWSTAGISTDKLFYVFQDGAPIWHAMVALGEYDRLFPHALLQYPDSRWNYNEGLTRDARAGLHGGGWHKLEVLWEANTPGVRNGGFRQWVDDQLVAESREAFWFPSGVVPRYDIVWFDPVYAWSAVTVPHDQSFYLDHTIISVK